MKGLKAVICAVAVLVAGAAAAQEPTPASPKKDVQARFEPPSILMELILSKKGA